MQVKERRSASLKIVLHISLQLLVCCRSVHIHLFANGFPALVLYEPLPSDDSNLRLVNVVDDVLNGDSLLNIFCELLVQLLSENQ